MYCTNDWSLDIKWAPIRRGERRKGNLLLDLTKRVRRVEVVLVRGQYQGDPLRTDGSSGDVVATANLFALLWATLQAS